LIEMFILKYSIIYKLDADLIRAIIAIESSAQSKCIRCEPTLESKGIGYHFPRESAKNNGLTFEQEKLLQHSSIGSMQILGVRARELGFEGHLLDLCDPELGINYGSINLKKLSERYGNDEEKIVAAYNAGSAIKRTSGMYINQGYVDKVFIKLREYRRLKN